MNVTIVDYKSGNISSVINSFNEVAQNKVKIEVTSNIKKIKATSWSEWIELERRRTRPERRVEFKTLKPFLRTEATYDLIFQLLRMYGVEVAWRVSSWDDVYCRDRIGREEYRYVVFF